MIDLGKVIDLLVDLLPASPKVEAHAHPNRLGDELYVVKDGYRIEERKGATYDRVIHEFTDIETFAKWLNRKAHPKHCDILLNSDRIDADLDPHVSESDVVRCSMLTHPRAARWTAVLGRPMSQKAFHRQVISALEDFEQVEADGGKKAVKFSRGELLAQQVGKLGVAKDSNYSAEIDERGTLRFAAATDKVNVTGELPSVFTVRVPLFVGIQKGDEPEAMYDLPIHLDLDASGPVPAFTLTCPSLEMIRHDAVKDARAWLEQCLADDFLVCVGHLRTEETQRRFIN